MSLLYYKIDCVDVVDNDESNKWNDDNRNVTWRFRSVLYINVQGQC